jgi:transcriptional regulator with XRE-family HTH domain
MTKADESALHVRCFGQAVVQMRELRNISREQLAKKSAVKLLVLTRIEEGTIDGGDFGLKEICGLAAGVGITPYRLMLAYESKLKDAGQERHMERCNETSVKGLSGDACGLAQKLPPAQPRK